MPEHKKSIGYKHDSEPINTARSNEYGKAEIKSPAKFSLKYIKSHGVDKPESNDTNNVA